MDKLIKRHYQAQIKRRTIDNRTTYLDSIKKMDEEDGEMFTAMYNYKYHHVIINDECFNVYFKDAA